MPTTSNSGLRMSTRKRKSDSNRGFIGLREPLIKFRMQLISPLVLIFTFSINFSVHCQSYTTVSYVAIMLTSADNSYNNYQVATFRDHLV